jgi:hypothetical protein
MSPSEIRMELLGQHAQMRSMIQRAGGLVARLRAGEPVRLELQMALGSLANTARVHNDREEALLRDVIPTVDAWGPARAEVMLDQHRLEHRALHAALQSSLNDDDAVACVSAAELLAHMLEHMKREEEAFLTEEVLRDDTVITNYFGG